MSASQRVVRFRKRNLDASQRRRGDKSSWGFILCFFFTLAKGAGEETIYSQSGKWPRQDKFQFSQLEIGGHQKCKREQQFEPDKVSTTWNSSCFYSSLTLTRSFVASTTAAFDPPLLLIQLLIISVDETTTFQGENTIEKASRKDPPFQMRRHMMITIAAQLSFQNSWSFQKKG